jgi:hypothetical protein
MDGEHIASGSPHGLDRLLTLTPPAVAFTPRERALVARLSTPAKVQAWLNGLRYNTEVHGQTQRSFRGVVRSGAAHCMEAAVSAATILEQHGYPPMIMSIESIDLLDHVLFIYRTATGWGSVARSRDPGLHGRRPVFRHPRALALSYVDPYVDYTGRVRGYGVVNLAEAMDEYNWRTSTRNLWKVEQMLIDLPHRRIRTSEARYQDLKLRYAEYRDRYGRKPVYYENRHTWKPLPPEFV